MNSTLKTFVMLLGATLGLNVAMNYMGDNIADFENRPLPPKRIQKFETRNPVMKVNAQSKEKWTLVDFSSGKTYQFTEPETHVKQLNELDWDLGFQRTKIISNGGVTNPKGKVKVANLGPVDFDRVDKLPEEGFREDVRSWGNVSNPSLADWYLYRTRTHNIESKKNVYLVRTGDGHLKMRIINYYCKRAESDCQTSMCPREEAACLSIEYLHIKKGERTFPVPTPALAQNAQARP